MTTTTPSADPDAPARSVVAANDTTLRIEERGEGPTLLVIHGAGEDAAMLAAQADALAQQGWHVVTYDRRGTGGSGRDDWPGGGADQHADDAAALIDALDRGPATLLGLSSGGVVAMATAARHPEAVARVIAWEAPALGLVPGAEAFQAELMAPVTAHLAAHPGDFVGAQALLLTMILGFPVSVDDPDFAAARENAEASVRDDPTIVLRPFSPQELDGVDLTVAVGGQPNEAVGAAASALEALVGVPNTVLEGADHEVYLHDPSALASLVGVAPQP